MRGVAFNAMREEKTDAELEALISQRLLIAGVYVSVRSDAMLGWRATVITAPKHAVYAQAMADRISGELRKRFILKRS